jgi:hypothetical protein
MPGRTRGDDATRSPRALLARLARMRTEFGAEAAARRLALLRALERARLRRASEVRRLHDLLCFIRAYPDDTGVLARATRMLARFDRRADLRRHRAALENSGIAGTAIRSRAFAFAASWLARRWGDRLAIDWDDFDGEARLESILHWLALYCETPGLDEMPFDAREWLDRLRGTQESDAAFLVRRFDALRADPLIRETTYEALSLPIRLSPSPDTPARTREAIRVARVSFQTGPLARTVAASRGAPGAAPAFAPPRAIRHARAREAARLLDLARGAMVTRGRDLDAFTHADPRSVRVADCGDGLSIAIVGMTPERRLLFEAVTGYLILKNGVAIGYGTASALFGSVEIAYNVFEAFRGAEAAPVYARVLGTFLALFGADAVTVYPYQLGDENDEALRSGAWWFYHKLGFRPRHRAAVALMRREERARRRDPRHRSSRATLERLAAHNVYLQAGRRRDDVLGALSLATVGLRITESLAARFGSRREQAEAACAREAMARLGVRSLARLSEGERLAWRRYAPLVAILPGLDRWTRDERRALAALIRAKGGPDEVDFVRRFDAHRALRAAVRRLARS